MQLARVSWLFVAVAVSCSSPDNPGSTGGSGAGQGNGGTLPGAGSSSGGSAGGLVGTSGSNDMVSGGSAGETSMAGSGGTGGSAGAAGAGGTATFSYTPITGQKWDELPLYPGDPPNYVADAPAETLDNNTGIIGGTSLPTLRRYAMDGSKATGYGYLVFPGGGYSILDMETHAAKLAERVGPLGIAVFSVKYRCGAGSKDAPRDALLDAKRAIRTVKHNAAQWAVDPAHLGVIGYSAGSHLALNLGANFDMGMPGAADAIEKQDSRPAFIGSMSTWAFGMKTSPFTFPGDVPPAFFCHAQDDTTAPIDLPKAVEAQIKAKGAATQLDFYDTGAHSTCHPGDPSMAGHNWPDKFWPFLQTALQ